MLKHFGLPGLDSLVQQDFSKVRTLFLKLCTKGAFQAHAALTRDLNLGWRDGKSFSACQRTGLGRAVAEEIYHAAGRKRFPGNLLLDGSWEGGAKGLLGVIPNFGKHSAS